VPAAPPPIGELAALLALFAEFGRGCSPRDLKTCSLLWSKLSEPDRLAAAAGVVASLADWRTRPSEKIPQPWNYLSGRYWERARTRLQPQREEGKFSRNFRQAAARFIKETSAGGKT
jgi:hypothetical protein